MIERMQQEPTLGKRIRRALERKRWSQQRLADELDVGVRTVNDWVNNRAKPKSSLGALEEILGVSLDDEDDEAAGLTQEARDLLRRAMPDPEDAERVIRFAEELAAERARGASPRRERRPA